MRRAQACQPGVRAAIFFSLNETSLPKSRLLAVFFFFTAVMVCLFVRLGFLQLFKSSKYQSIAQSQSRAIIEMQPARGRIVDRKGRELASDVRLDSLYAVSREIKNKKEVAAQLSQILGMDEAELLRRLSKDKMFVWIARKLSPIKSEAVRRLKVKGLDFVKESQRVYPKGETACQLVGFTDIDNVGLEGIERHLDGYLKGVPGWRLAQKDAKRRELISKEIEMVAPVDGYDVHLTIDEVIQSAAERVLAATCKKHNALGGSIIVMEPKSGDVLALAMYPQYDLNNARRSTPEQRRNRAITDLFEPGSVFKAFTLAGVLENKTFPLDEKFDCENGTWGVAGKVLHDVHGYGVITFREVIEKSSNIGTVKGAMRLGAAKFYETVKNFGFGKATGIDLTGEIGGILPSPKNWSRSSIINIPIGQGVAVTPIQLCAAMAAIANNGVLMKPRIIVGVDDANGKVIQKNNPEIVREAVSRETAMQVRSVLEGVVARGTGKKAQVPGFKAGGKTGTAQKLLPGGGYSHDAFIASFVGLVPYDEPKVVITVSVDQPHPVYYGGEVAAPAFSQLAREILSYWRILPTPVPDAVRPVASGAVPGKKIAAQPPIQSVTGQ